MISALRGNVLRQLVCFSVTFSFWRHGLSCIIARQRFVPQDTAQGVASRRRFCSELFNVFLSETHKSFYKSAQFSIGEAFMS